MSFTHSQSHQLRTAIFTQSVIAKSISLIENFNFSTASGPIEARNFSKSNPEPDPNPTSTSPIDNSGPTKTGHVDAGQDECSSFADASCFFMHRINAFFSFVSFSKV